MKGNKISGICILLGLVLILASVGLLLWQNFRAQNARVDTAAILDKTLSQLPPAVDAVPEARGNNAMPSRQIDGVDVIGVLEFSRQGRVLPLAGDWHTDRVNSLPCRFTGSIYDSSLIIGAVDSQDQIPFADSLEVGDGIVLTDMEGGCYHYRVAAIHHAKHATRSKLQQGDYPLTIFVKDSQNDQYLLIRCEIGK